MENIVCIAETELNWIQHPTVTENVAVGGELAKPLTLTHTCLGQVQFSATHSHCHAPRSNTNPGDKAFSHKWIYLNSCANVKRSNKPQWFSQEMLSNCAVVWVTELSSAELYCEIIKVENENRKYSSPCFSISHELDTLTGYKYTYEFIYLVFPPENNISQHSQQMVLEVT